MIIINLRRLSLLKGISKSFTLLKFMGLTRKMAANYMTGNYKSIKLDDLEQICLVWNCTPNDVLEWVKSPKDVDLPAGHPLNAIFRPETPENVGFWLMKASPDKMKEVMKLLKEGEE